MILYMRGRPQVRTQLLPVRDRVRAGALPTAAGVSYLEVL